MKIVLKTSVTSDDVDAVRSLLIASNQEKSGRPSGYHPFAFHIIDDDGKPVGGATGHGSFDWIFLELLFVPESLRGQGWGRRLIKQVEEFGRTHGLIGVWLDTFSFQARPFYEKLGYSVAGMIEDYPIGERCFFMQKRLDAQPTH